MFAELAPVSVERPGARQPVPAPTATDLDHPLT
jgi:hypothetical protein